MELETRKYIRETYKKAFLPQEKCIDVSDTKFFEIESLSAIILYGNFSSTRETAVCDEEIDVEEDVVQAFLPPVDFTRAQHQMDELQRLANFARQDDNEDWEEQLDKIPWSPVQNRIFTKVLEILNSERLARLAKASNLIEPIHRRTLVDTAARRFRETLASAGWDWRLAQWLHSLLFDHLPQQYLGIYLDILQTLRLKIPQLIDKMIAVQPNINAKTGSITWETLGSLLKRSWDPISPSLNINRIVIMLDYIDYCMLVYIIT